MAVRWSKDAKKIEFDEDSSDGSKTYRRTILVEVTDRADGALVAMTVAPAMGATLVTTQLTDLTAKVVSRTPRAIDDLHFEIDIVYSTREDQAARERRENPDPLARPPYNMAGGFKTRQIPRVVDVEGKAVVNSAGTFFADPYMDEVKDPTLTITKNVASVDFDQIREYVGENGSVNSDTFLGWAPGEVLCDSITFTGPQIENDVTFWVVTYLFVFRIGGWKAKICDMGKYQTTGVVVDGRKVVSPIYDEYGCPVSEPVKLDGEGAAADADADMVFVEFQFHPSRNFAALGLV